jgi:Ca2+-binding RTX toxin-like protein
MRGGAGDDLVRINDGHSVTSVDCGPGDDTVVLDPRHAKGGISDAQLLRRGGIVGCEHVEYAAAPPKDPETGVTWIAPRSGGRKTGTSRNDNLLGSHGADTIHAEAGDDVLWGDLLNADESDATDQLFAGGGADTVYGGPGSNVIDGGFGDDYLQGGTGRNRITAGAGNDTVRLRGQGPNTVYAGAGNDTIFSYTKKTSTIHCGPGYDTVEANRRVKLAGDCEKVTHSLGGG